MISVNSPEQRARPARPNVTRMIRASLVVLLSMGVTGCEGLLDVRMPGSVVQADIEHPDMARTLVASAQGELECSFMYWVFMSSMWAGETYWGSSDGTGSLVFAERRPSVDTFTGTRCDGGRGSQAHTWTPMQIARSAPEMYIEIIESHPDEAVPPVEKDFLVGKLYAHAGYATLLLSEGHCEVTFNQGPLMTREQGFERAIGLFASAIERSGRVTSGPDAADALAVKNLSYVGRARAQLNLGNYAGVISDASQVEDDFVWYAEMSASSSRRSNFFWGGGAPQTVVPRPEYWNLEVDGVPDPRVPITLVASGPHTWDSPFALDGVTPWAGQLKYLSLSSDIRLSSWREAQLMIAEATGGQTAVDIINELRATPHGLPPFSSSDDAEIREQLIEERRREFFLEGVRLGDMLRYEQPFPTGLHPRGTSFPGPFERTCIPMPDVEWQTNPNL